MVPCSRRSLAVALAGLGWTLTPTSAVASAAGPGMAAVAAVAAAATAPEDAATRAKAAEAKARRAVRAKNYERALEAYEDALELQPTAKRHFNVGACHHRLMMAQPETSPAYETHRRAAVHAYNRYLEAAPGAEDTAAVSEMIRAMGGTPLSAEAPEPWTIDLVEPEDVPDPPRLDDGDDGRPRPDIPASDPPPSPAPGPLLRPRWGLGVFLPLTLINPAQSAASDELRAAPNLGLGLSGHGYLGQRRGLHLGGEMALSGQTVSSRRRHRHSLAFVTLVLEGRRMMGQARWEIGGGGSIGLGTQALVFDGEPRLRCAKEREASRRNGMWATARIYAAVLLGKRRDHALTFRAGPGVGVFGPASKIKTGADGETCDDEPTAFATFGIDERAAFVLTFDIGYSPRF